jgi:glycerol-3-phosphate dehydrogenase
MAHGGLRYLEGREFRLVAEAARERNRLLKLANHLVSPLEIVIPLDSWVQGFARAVGRFLGLSSQSGPPSLLALKGALVLYDLMGRRERVLPGHRAMLTRKRLTAGLAARFKAGASYFDGQILNPEGLVLEMLKEGLDASHRAAAINHASWTMDPDGTLTARDRFDQQVIGPIKPKVIINASGAWIDDINGKLGLKTAYVRKVKGAHLVLKNATLHERMAGRAFYFDDGTGRMIITLPVGDQVLVGTTEVESTDPEDRTVAPDEVSYLLGAMNRLFDDIPVTQDQIISVTTGIRPLQAGNGDATSAARDHALEEDHLDTPDACAVLSLVGGKWTTFRAFAEETADRAMDRLGHRRSEQTANRPFPGAAPTSIDAVCRAGGLTSEGAQRLVDRYGALALEVAEWIADRGDCPLPNAPSYQEGEIRWLITQRAACTVEDLVLRRTQLALSGDTSPQTLRALGDLLIATIGRSPAEIDAEIDAAGKDPRTAGFRFQGDTSRHD